MSEKDRGILLRLIEKCHPEQVLLVVAEYCDKQKAHCDTVPDYSAIGQEWATASSLIRKAANEIGQ